MSAVILVTVLLTTRVNNLPRLDTSYCTAGAVVIADVERVVEDESSSQPAFVCLKVIRAFKGPIPEESSFRLKGHSGYRVGQRRFLFVKDEESLRSRERLAWTFDRAAEHALPILTQMFSEMTVSNSDIVDLDPDHLVLP